ncbi:ribonuclease H-like domain-containing protein [Thermodesulfovibrio thiophilus]|uniref:ribonuclease H-like domain-containing protein n=1 Tax=Thermodesulfovibrio thiophilus TaxID=340095 RepID=UPI00182DF8C2|nr:ribonuclease H-like domain-containing protein [Thermodesulfovibrio thiophilus]HHW20207.1 ribonuclease H-like domain-containing protein [Thermodesulfovibrio thiophilus]
MIKNSFILLDGIGEKRERKLWKEGILTWEDFFQYQKILDIDYERKKLYDEFLYKALEALQNRDCCFFTKNLRKREHWRLFEDLLNNAVCLDIETNGYTVEKGGHVTVVGLYSPTGYQALVKGENLTGESLQQALDEYKYLITFYGSIFDIPFLKTEFPNLKIDHLPHFDLFFAAKRLGIQGGLKKLETLFLIEREDELKGLNGYDAIKLWQSYLKGSIDSLELLISYNRADTENLFYIGKIFYDMLRSQIGIEEFIGNGRNRTPQKIS